MARGGVRRGVQRALTDAISQTSGLVLIAVAAAIFAVAAVVGLTLIGQLGTFGWVAYAVVLGVVGLSVGPIVATGVSVRMSGSARQRQERERRLLEQRRKFGLPLEGLPEPAGRRRR